MTKQTEESLDKWGMYAEMALLMFYSFVCLDDLNFNGSCWERFTEELHCHLDSKSTKFWEKGFEILQNINDRLTLEKEINRAKDPIFVTTVNEKPMKTDCKEIDFQKHTNDTDDILQMEIHSR